jgi:hypothetical protein
VGGWGGVRLDTMPSLIEFRSVLLECTVGI